MRTVLATGLGGAISGVIIDPYGALISGASVTLTSSTTGAALTSITDSEGFFAFTGLSPGTYSLRAEASGFNPSIIERIQVRLSITTSVDVTLQVGSRSETVTVEARATELQVATEVAELRLQSRNFPQLVQVQPGVEADQFIEMFWLRRDPKLASTPRLRQDFPETLAWQPSLITDSHGNAELKFNVADSITTWRLAVIGSTEDGLIGVATADLRAFQPFFAEHQPPPSLTVGDEIETPIVVRNYQDRAADVNVRLAPAPWMQLLSGGDQSVHADAKGSATALATFRAIAAGDFKQEASAIGTDEGDRVARPVSVRFDGSDTWQTYADLFQGETSLDVNIPENAIADSPHIELDVFPDLFAHAVQGIDGIVQRPHGCLEQTTSAGYANLLVLQYLKRSGRALPSIERQAAANLAETLARIRSFANPDGGYFYFAGTQADTALTAYVLRFLTEAREFVMVDNILIEATRQYLARGQRADGAWVARDYNGQELSRQATARLTALVARSLAASEPQLEKPKAENPQPVKSSPSISAAHARAALSRSIEWLSKAVREYDDPYALALYVLAAHGTGRDDAAHESALALAALSRPEQGAVFWDPQSNTPFYGWGRAGRLETTGLAIEALAACSRDAGPSTLSAKSKEPDVLERAARRGLLFVIRNKDEYGVWYSTQATVNVLRGLLAAATRVDAASSQTFKLAIGVDGGEIKTIDIPAQSGSPIPLDLSAMFPQLATRTGNHRLVLKGDPARAVGAGILARASVPWIDKDARGISEDGGLRLRVTFDRLDVEKGETVTCSVHAERIGSAGYGMMLAEVGLPPGVDVDVASLRHAGVLSFDATPDRVVFYLWPRAGGSDFSFTFRPRLRIKAATQPSTLYDYYNPDARVSVPPARFVVR
ncbi:MAG TPA: alpha-2-macroglobulin family protein [Blastocatellia bacterium]|nr:alpha-2-macroglobulin family protein [Blastocatellia bacterium]